MSRLQVFHEDDAATPVLATEDSDVIASSLSAIGVRFERWPLRAHNNDILAAYAPEIEALKADK